MIERPDYNERGERYARCLNCGMGWFESAEPVELFDGVWSASGERQHTCPEPYDIDTARALVSRHSTTRIPMHPETYARCVLAYRAAGEEA